MSENTKPAESGKATAKKKGTVTTELVIGSAAVSIKKAIISLGEAVSKVSDLADKAEDIQGIIAQREDRIKELDTEFKEKKRQKEVELEVRLKEDERNTVSSILNSRGMIAVDRTEHAELVQKADKTNRDVEREISSAVGAATGSMKKDHEAANALLASQNETKEASNKAIIESLMSKNEFLVEQVEMWKGALDAERAASVERSKAASIGTLNVGATNK